MGWCRSNYRLSNWIAKFQIKAPINHTLFTFWRFPGVKISMSTICTQPSLHDSENNGKSQMKYLWYLEECAQMTVYQHLPVLNRRQFSDVIGHLLYWKGDRRLWSSHTFSSNPEPLTLNARAAPSMHFPREQTLRSPPGAAPLVAGLCLS